MHPPDEVEIIAGFFESQEKETTASLRWPLLQNAAVRHNGHEALFESALSVKSHPFLDDHRIDEKVVVPSVVAVELMAETVQAGWPQWRIIEVQNHQQLRGMILEAGNDLEVRVTAKLQRKRHYRPCQGDDRQRRIKAQAILPGRFPSQ